jgi:hypothetical protein
MKSQIPTTFEKKYEMVQNLESRSDLERGKCASENCGKYVYINACYRM